MVKENEEDLNLRPEEKVAQRFLRKLGTQIPADAEKIAASLADIETAPLPRGADALLLSTSPTRKKPLIILQNNISNTRRRFTLAHEIGHIRIPWHVGTFLCHPDSVSAKYVPEYQTIETEANRFASEFLLPLSWLQSLLANGKTLEDQFTMALNTGVSDAVVTIAVGRVKGTGLIIANVDGGIVVQRSRSAGTLANLPLSNDIEDWKSTLDSALENGTFYGTSNHIYWWRFSNKRKLIVQEKFKTSSEALDAVIAEICKSSEEAKKLRASISSITGALSGTRRPKSPEELHAIFIHELRDHSNPMAKKCTKHPDFDAYLSLRSAELFAAKKW